VKAVAARQCQDWIESFLRSTSEHPSPEIFRRWAAISAIAGALQRRVWTITASAPTHPNMYILLVARWHRQERGNRAGGRTLARRPGDPLRP
jgi:hypothetical protein